MELGSNHGAIFNPKKFQFCRREVEYAGLVISDSGVRPPAEMFKCIREFPTPKNITDVRAWFGMVAQVSFAFSELPVMAPFRHLLSSKTPFAWSSELEEAFQQSKRRIIGECVHGVRNFDPQLPTCLATDWSKTGIGFWLCQKHCQCTADQPGCCRDGWQTAYMGSRFCTPTEQRYAPIEGEAMAAAWAANKCRYYLLGMKEWLLAVDHKPLIPILSTKELLAIPNPRLANQRVKLLPFNLQTSPHCRQDQCCPGHIVQSCASWTVTCYSSPDPSPGCPRGQSRVRRYIWPSRMGSQTSWTWRP